MKKIIFRIVLILVLLSNKSFSQNFRRGLDIRLEEIKADFKYPDGFVELDSLDTFDRGDGKLYSAFLYSIVNDKQGVAIAMGPGKIRKESKEMVASMKRIMPNYNPDRNTDYIRRINREAFDTLKNPVIYHPVMYSQKQFNADVSGQYHIKFRIPYKGKFNNGKVVFIHKEHQADVFLYYFYTDEAKDKIDKYIEKTSGMIRFRP